MAHRVQLSPAYCSSVTDVELVPPAALKVSMVRRGPSVLQHDSKSFGTIFSSRMAGKLKMEKKVGVCTPPYLTLV